MVKCFAFRESSREMSSSPQRERDVEMSDVTLTGMVREGDSDGGLMRARFQAEDGPVTRRVKECFGLSRAEGHRAVHCLAACTVVNVLLVAIIAAVGASLASSPPPPPTSTSRSATTTAGAEGKGKSDRWSWRSLDAPEHVWTTKGGAVAADEPRCSAVGADVLRDGGSAVDAAIATALCLGITHPHSSGVGGGAFMIVHLANGTSEAIEFREEAPSASSRDMYLANSSSSSSSSSSTPPSSLFGGLAVAVPTELHGMRVAWERHGKLPWERLVTPAANLADGFVVGKALAREIAKEAEKLAAFPATAAVFLKPDGKSPLLEGDICRNVQLAKTLRRVAEEGPGILRQGPLAESLAADIRAAGGIISAADLARYQPRIVPPLRASAMGYTLLGMPPPSSGGAAVTQILEFLSGYDVPLASAGVLGTHRLTEALKHAFAMRMNLGDPEFLTGVGAGAGGVGGGGGGAGLSNLDAAVRDMLSPEFNAQLRRETLDNATREATAYGAKWNQLEDSGTTHLSVVDASRNAVAMTSTINTGFGSKVVSPSTGILLNNEMDDFSSPGVPNGYGLAPSEANYIAPGKRPLSSMSPTIVLDDRTGAIFAVAGASGGPRIITSTAQVLLNVLARGLDPLTAVNRPRLHHQLIPHKVFAENQIALGDGTLRRLPSEEVAALRTRGHEVEYSADKTAVVQLIVVDPNTNTVHAVSDTRKGGRPAAE